MLFGVLPKIVAISDGANPALCSNSICSTKGLPFTVSKEINLISVESLLSTFRSMSSLIRLHPFQQGPLLCHNSRRSPKNSGDFLIPESKRCQKCYLLLQCSFLNLYGVQ